MKVDKSFIDRIENRPVTRAVIRSIIEICHRAGLSVVAEGVENERQLEFLRDNACDDAQGFE